MGKGGDNTVSQQSSFKLSSLPTEELRKWAKAYGLDVDDDKRETLLKELVRR